MYFGNTHKFLSPFTEHTINVNNITFPSVYHYYLYKKFNRPDDNEWVDEVLSKDTVRDLMLTSNMQTYKLTDNWDLVKYDIMKNAIYLKIQQNEDVKKYVYSLTAKIFKYNESHFSYWGYSGKDWMNKLLQELIIKPSESAESAELSEPSESAELSEPSEPSEPSESADPSTSTEDKKRFITFNEMTDNYLEMVRDRLNKRYHLGKYKIVNELTEIQNPIEKIINYYVDNYLSSTIEQLMEKYTRKEIVDYISEHGTFDPRRDYLLLLDEYSYHLKPENTFENVLNKYIKSNQEHKSTKQDSINISNVSKINSSNLSPKEKLDALRIEYNNTINKTNIEDLENKYNTITITEQEVEEIEVKEQKQELTVDNVLLKYRSFNKDNSINNVLNKYNKKYITKKDKVNNIKYKYKNVPIKI
jgi:ribA/ribD-fused uncharacterized protein